jgi:hypothetical protein
MTGQDGGFRAAAARFRSEVEAALTRARRAASEAKAHTADFRRGTDEFAKQAKSGRLRGARGHLTPTDPRSRTDAENFRHANGLPVEKLPDADKLLHQLPPAPAEELPPRREDEDFSQHQVLFDLDAEPTAGDQEAERPDHRAGPDAEQEPPRIDSSAAENTRRSDEDEDFSQQRILLDATVESYRPDTLQGSVFEPSDQQKPS